MGKSACGHERARNACGLGDGREGRYHRRVLGKILVGGIKFHGYHGLTRIEREIGVRYSVDVDLDCDLEAAAASDQVKDTIDYRAVHHTVVEIGRKGSYRLIETLAAKIADAMLARTKAAAVTVRVLKETPILDGIVDSVSVELRRERKKAK